MKVTVTDVVAAAPGRHPLLESPQYAAQLAGGSLFFQVMSGLSENPVRVRLHDKRSGEKMDLEILLDGPFKKIGDVPPPEVKEVPVKKVAGPTLVTLPPMKAPSFDLKPRTASPSLKSPSLSPPAPSPSPKLSPSPSPSLKK